jgi:hypothetical protein
MADRTVLGKLKQEPEGRAVIRADSAEEAYGLLAHLFSKNAPEAGAWRGRVLLFTSAEAARGEGT